MSNNVSMKQTFFLSVSIFLLSLSLTAQTKQLKYKKTASGLEYAIISKGKGNKVPIGYRVSINYTTRINPDSIFDSSAELKHPFSFILGQGEVLKGWDEAISILNVGDSASFKIPSQLAYGSSKVGKIPANSTLLFEVRVLKAEQAFYDLIKKDTALLVAGLKTLIIKEGAGKQAKSFEEVTVGYTGYYINENKQRKIFESSLITGQPLTFQLGAGKFIKGLDIGITGMKEGGNNTFIVSPELAFGSNAKGKVPANSTVYFDIELLSSRDPFFDGSNKDTIRTKSGMKMLLINEGTGKKINKGNYVVWNFIGYIKDAQGNKIIFDNTFNRNKPASFRPGSQKSLKGWEEAALLLKPGGKASLALSSALAYGEKEMQNIPKGATVYFDVEVMNVIEPYYDVIGKDTVTKPSGLKYIIITNGAGEPAKVGSTVSLVYVGFIIDSLNERAIFDASIEHGRSIEFKLGEGRVIKGWDEAVEGMVIGEKRRLIIPEYLGYGHSGMPPVIPPDATLYFDIELVEIKK